MKECERYRDYLLRRSDLVIKFKKILCQKYLDSEEIYRLSESIMLIDSLLSRPPPLLSSSSSSPHYLLSSSSGAVASLLSLCVSPKRMLRPLLLIWMCTAVRGEPESVCSDISKLFVEAHCDDTLICESPHTSGDMKLLECEKDMSMEARDSRKGSWDKIKDVECGTKNLKVARVKGKSKNFDYLQFRCVGAACKARTVGTQLDCDSQKGETCESAFITPEKSKVSCKPNYALEVYEIGSVKFTELEKDSKNRCVGERFTSSPKYPEKAKVSDTRFRCRSFECSVATKAAFDKDVEGCPTKDKCLPAKLNDHKSGITCDSGYALELQTDKKRWIEVVDNKCVRSALTFTLRDKKDYTVLLTDAYRCRDLRKCEVSRYFVNDCASKLDKECIQPSATFGCSHPAKLKISFTKVIDWKDGLKIKCESNKMTVEEDDENEKEVFGIPLAVQCIKDAECGINIASIYDKACDESYEDQDGKVIKDECGQPELDAAIKNEIICTKKDHLLEFHEPKKRWMRIPKLKCYNDVLFDELRNLKNLNGKGKFRCRNSRGKDMSKYFSKKKEQCKEVLNQQMEYKCVEPTKKDDGTYICKPEKVFDYKFQAKFMEGEDWTEIKSAKYEFKNFVVDEGTGKLKSFIPIRFRCIREATCEVDLDKMYNDEDCPKRPDNTKDNCKKPIKKAPDEKQIVCEGPNGMVLEYQEESKPWKELSEILCIFDKMTLKNSAGLVGVTPKRIRCREPRDCNMDDYYDASDCGGQALCEKPTFPKVGKICKDNYFLQYQSLGVWQKIHDITCKNKRFWLLDDNNNELEDIPISFRCSLDRKCDLAHYYMGGECETNEDCLPPVKSSTNIEKLICEDSMMTLRVKTVKSTKWEVVKSIECKDDKEFVVFYDDKKQKKYEPFPHRIQCIKMKTTTCEDPRDPTITSGSIVQFNQAKTWEDTTTLQCGPLEKLVIGRIDQWDHHTKPLKCGDTGLKWVPEETDTELEELRKRKGITSGACLTTACMKAAEGGLKCEKSSKCEQSLVCETCIKAGDQTNAMVIGCEEKKDIMIYDAIKREKVPYENNTAKFVCERGIWQTETGDYFDNAPRIFCVECPKLICNNCTEIPNMRNALGCDNATQLASVRKTEGETSRLQNQTFVCKYGKWYKGSGELLDGDDKLRIDCIPKSMDPNNQKDEIKGNGETNLTWLWLVVAIIVIALIVGAVVGVVFMRRKKNAPAVVPEEPKEDPLYDTRFDPVVGGPIDGLSRMMKINKNTGDEVCVNEGCIPAKNIKIKKEPLKIGGVTFNNHPADHKMANQTDGDTVVKVTIDNEPEAVFIGEGAEQVLPDSIDTSEIENAPNLNEEEEKQWKAIDDRMTVLNNIMLNDDTPKEEKDACAAEYKKIKEDNAKLMQKKGQYHYSAGLRDNDRRIAEEKKKDEARKKAKESPSSGGSSGNKKKKETSKKRK